MSNKRIPSALLGAMLFSSVLLSGCAAGLMGVGLNALALGTVARGAAEKKADRCFDEEIKIVKYASKGSPAYRRDMAKKDCPTS